MGPPPVGRVAQKLAAFALSVALLGGLPFYTMVRGSVYLHRHQGLPAWPALAAGILVTLVIVAAYAAWLARRITGKPRWPVVAKWFALPVVTFYAAFALVYLSSANVKSPAVRDLYTAVHPLLRVALATVILADQEIVVTDLGRAPDDYARMGLPPNDATLHYRQRDGWIHAVDLRTIGRGEIRNRLVQVYFWTMGFETLRHAGTADHLHVALALP